jgi:hypothetical protein
MQKNMRLTISHLALYFIIGATGHHYRFIALVCVVCPLLYHAGSMLQAVQRYHCRAGLFESRLDCALKSPPWTVGM